MQWNGPNKCMWNNKFHAPTLAQLREGYPKPLTQLFDDARELLLNLSGVSESIAWHGVPWRWTLVYRCASEDREPVTRAFAYVVPDPARLQVCIPLSQSLVASLPMRRFKKGLRDTIIHARTVAGLSWPSWDIPTHQSLEDVAELIRRKHRLVDGPAERVALSA